MFGFILAIVLAGPVDVASSELVLRSGTIRSEIEGRRLRLFVTDRDETVLCTEYTKKLWTHYSRLLREMGEGVAEHPDAEWGDAKTGLTGFSGSQAVGYCNANGSTREGTIYMTWVVNRACFGSAGCNRDIVTVAMTPDQALKLAGIIDDYVGQ